MSIPALKETIAKQISESAPQVKDLVVKKLVDMEVQKRAKGLEQAIGIVDGLEKDVQVRSKTDQKHLDATGTVTSESYSLGAFDALKKAKEKLDKAHKAVNRALDSGDWDGLFKFVAESSGKGGEQKNA